MQCPRLPAALALALALLATPLAGQRPVRPVRPVAPDTTADAPVHPGVRPAERDDAARARLAPAARDTPLSGAGAPPAPAPGPPGAGAPPVPAPGAAAVLVTPEAVGPRDSTRLAGMQGDTLRLYLGLEPLGPLFPLTLPPAPGRDALWLRPRMEDWTAAWAAAARRNAAPRLETVGLARDSAAGAAPPAQDCCGFLPPLPRDTARPKNALLPGAVADYADIGMRVSGRGELGSAWTRYYPCDPSTPILCNPSLFPQLKPDVQFGVQVGGTISDRVHVNVDYDQRREFDAANNINVYYQGMDDEVLQRVEVGDVSINLPQSRYLTQGIPAGNFGFKATGQLGPIDFQTVFAQQRGDLSRREFRMNGGAGQSAGLVQDATVTLDDADYVKGQFFFVVDPDLLRGAPHVNALTLQAGDAPDSVRPLGGTLVLYRDERISPSSQAQVGQIGYFLANATVPDSSLKHSGFFRRLVQGQDYIVHPSGLWIVLRSPLRSDEALAMGYITARGDTVGSINADNAQQTGTPTLRLLRGPLSMHQPGQATWPYEMHQVYRVDASSGVDVSSVDLKISLGQISGGKTFATANGSQITYLRLMGLDELPPTDVIDDGQIYQPSVSAAASGTGSGGVGGTFVVFPTLRPFAAPPPVPSAGLSAAQAAAALASDSNSAIYENPDPVARDAATRFRLNFSYRVKLDGMVSTLNLGALGIREGSEKIFVGGQQLENGKDYTIDYDIGTVTLLNPQALFAANPEADIRATWEQKSAFQIAPTSIFGLNTRYKFGGRGELNLIGLYQAEKTLMARPQLGTEPSSIFLGGVSGTFDLGGRALDALLARVPGLHATGPSSVSLSGEAAMSAPSPNTSGAAYVDDFESGDETTVSLTRQSWRLGSRPEAATGAADVLPPARDVGDAMRLVWQHDYLVNGQVLGSLRPQQDIDHQLNVTGATSDAATETVMWMTLGGDSMPQHATVEPRWRSITTVLSTTGRDMSRSEDLEFYARTDLSDEGAALVLDLGTVSEDAYYYDAQGNTNGVYPDGRPWGLGVLDQEVDLTRHEVWGTAADTLGLWNQACRAAPLSNYPLGDLRANCTRGNGLIDTEDLDGNGAPDQSDGAYFRYVVPLGPGSPYLVRDRASTGTQFRLFRIPIRGAGAISVGGAGDGTLRFIKDLRVTVVDSVGGNVTHLIGLTRLRIIGSRWAKRDLAGLESGLSGSNPVASDTAAFQVGPISALTAVDYASPPGVLAQAQDPTSQFSVGAAQVINEKSLRLAVDRLAPGTRAEAYYRYPQQPRSFMNYREMRVWAVARQGSWGATGDERLLIKVGSDPDNYYLYQARLNPPGQGAVSAAQWQPEIVIDFNQWFALRAAAEQALVSAPADTAPLMLWSRDSSYAIVLQDRARAPNLAAVRELSFAVYNAGMGAEPTEVWIDDMRLTRVMSDPGFAGNLTLALRAGDFLNATATMSNQGALYHQLNQDPSYQRTADASLNGSAQLGLLLPTAWDMDAPLSFSWGRTTQAPQFLAGTDLPAGELADLRPTGGRQMRLGLSLHRRTPAPNRWVGLVMDGLALRLGYSTASTGTATSLARSRGVDGALTYDRRPSARELPVVPGFLKRALAALFPRRLENTDFFRRLTTAELRWTPEAFSFSTTYYNQESDAFRYDQILRLPTDTLPATVSARQGLDNAARLAMHPFESLTAAVSLSSTRDLLPARRASDQPLVQQAIEAARGGVGGLDLGWESARSLSSQLDWRPTVAAWLRPSFSYSASYRLGRNASYLRLVPLESDTTARMQAQFQATRQLTRALRLDPKGLVNALNAGRKPTGKLAGIAGAIEPIELTWTSALGSSFDRADQPPGVSYQLGLGSLAGWRVLGPDTASAANTRSGLRLRSGLMLPFGTELTGSYDGSTTHVIDLQGGERTDRNTTWPVVQLTWSRIPLPALLRSFLTQAGISAGYQHSKRGSAYGGLGLGTPDLSGDAGSGGTLPGANVSRGAGEDVTVPIQASLGLLSTLSASYNGSISSGTASDPTGDMRKKASTHTISLSGFFKAPSSMRHSFPNPIQATLGLTRQADRECHVVVSTAPGAGDCQPFIDYTTRRLDLSLNTDLNQLTVGFQMSYNAHANNIGTLNGSSQFQLGVFGQFNISAGQLPGMGGAPGLGRSR